MKEKNQVRVDSHFCRKSNTVESFFITVGITILFILDMQSFLVFRSLLNLVISVRLRVIVTANHFVINQLQFIRRL